MYMYVYGYKYSRFGSQWCNGSVCYRYGGRGNWLPCNVGNISVLNHEGEPMDIKQAGVCTRAHVQTLCKIYAGERLKSQSIHYKQKVKVKTEWWSNDGAFGIWCRIFSQRQRETNLLQHADNGIAQRFSKSGLRTGRELNPDPYFVFQAHLYHSDLRAWHTHTRTRTHTHTHACTRVHEPVLQCLPTLL